MLARIADGDEHALESFFHLFYPRLKYFCLDLLKDQGEAEDIAQMAITAFWQQRQGFRHATIKKAESFLFTVARNKCYNYIKHLQVHSSKQKELVEAADTIDDLLESRIIEEDLFYRVYQELLTLSPTQVRLLKMIFVEELQTQEIADRLGLTVNNVRNQKARALEKLRTVLQKKRLMLPVLLFFLKLL
jgi:RNA polymerase sigma-70 factor (ECF subfamily)